MKIITTPDPRLRVKAQKISPTSLETHKIVELMIAASLDWEKSHPYEISAAMAAPQLGINKRIIIIRDDTSDKNHDSFTALINPEVIRTSGPLIKDYEGCLSVPLIYGMVPRPTQAKIKAETLDGTPVRIKAQNELARTLLHEIDHLEGILFIDHIKDQTDAFFELNAKGDIVPVPYDRIVHNKNLFPED